MIENEFKKKSLFQKKHNKKMALVLSIIILLSGICGGTLAYIAVSTNNVKNQFIPVEVTCRVNADSDEIDVTNTGDIDAYIRAAIVVNWMDVSGNVLGEAPLEDSDYTLTINDSETTENGGKYWVYDSGTGFYYYNTRVAKDANTNPIIEGITKKTEKSGYLLSVEVVAEAIQADGDTDDDSTPAYEDAWGITVYSN